MHHFTTLLFAIALGALGTILSTQSALASSVSVKVSTVVEFSDGFWPENLAVRHTGQLLVTRLQTPQLYLVDPIDQSSTLIYESTAAVDSIFGITEVETDVFVFAAGNFSANGATPGSFSIWTIDLRLYEDHHEVHAFKLTDIPEAGHVNGVAKVSPSSSKVLLADSRNAVVFTVDYKTGEYEVAMFGESLAFAKDTTITVGVNGIKTHDHAAYYTNLDQETVFRVAINDDGQATSDVQPLAHVMGDDLLVSDDGKTVYVAALFARQLVAIDAVSGDSYTVAGSADSLEVSEPTALAWGRTDSDRRTLYVTTTGGQANGDKDMMTAAKVLAIELPHNQC